MTRPEAIYGAFTAIGGKGRGLIPGSYCSAKAAVSFFLKQGKISSWRLLSFSGGHVISMVRLLIIGIFGMPEEQMEKECLTAAASFELLMKCTAGAMDRRTR